MTDKPGDNLIGNMATSGMLPGAYNTTSQIFKQDRDEWGQI